MSDFFAIECSQSEGYKCSTGDNSLNNIVTIANAWIDAFCLIFGKDSKNSIFHQLPPSDLSLLYLPKPNTTSTNYTNNTSSDQQQLQNSSLVCIGSPNEHSNTQLPQNH